MAEDTAASRRHLALLQTERFGRYRLLAELGGGGMARVFLANFDGPGGFVKPCVVKKVRPEYLHDAEFRSMFLNEARVAALLSHPNIVQAFDFGECDGEHYLALEYVEGASLADVVRACRKAGRTVPLSVVTHVGIGLCEALSCVHAARGPDGAPLRAIHRDVTPANVLVSRTGAVKLADFGVVKSALNAMASKPGVLKGKATYLSPEQARLEPLDSRSDLFGLGLVLYELCTGRSALARGSFEASIRAAANAEIALPSAFVPGFPPRFERILARALTARRDDRYASADEMRAALEVYRSEERFGPANQELSALLVELFPNGMPTKPPAAPPSPLAAPVTPAEIDEIDEIDFEEVELLEPPPTRHWREIAFAAAVGLAATAAFWLFVLP
ncbi:MAG TPA: serine/threonine-protein kinase [Myxococcales bacterium]|jgi:serine/threonine-protein kinase